jgi:polar amino acid transport system substrate-binding protein
VKWIRVLCFGIISVFVFLANVPISADVEVLKLAKQPKAAVTAKAKPILICVLDKIGQRYELIDVPWARAQFGTRKGTYDGFFVAGRTNIRDSYATASSAILYTEWYFITNKAQSLSPEVPGFRSLNFAASRGTAKHGWLVHEKEKGRITGLIMHGANTVSAWKMLVSRRFDVLLENRQNLDQIMAMEEFEKEKFKIFVARKIPLSVYFGNDFLLRSPKFLTSFNRNLVDCL